MWATLGVAKRAARASADLIPGEGTGQIGGH